jgi:hypothetical protein
MKSRQTRAITLSFLVLLFGCMEGAPNSDDADLTPIARMVEAMQAAHPDHAMTLADTLGKSGRSGDVDFEVPDTIRIWLRSEGGATSCGGPVEELDFETYVARVLAHEWYMSWEHDSHKAGAIAIRSYAAWWVNAGGKYDCADVCDTTYTQAYGEDSHDAADLATDATTGLFIVEEGSVVFAEYSSENSDPTAYGVSDPYCTGLDVYGHGRGMCQWGTQRWSLNESATPEWMVEHYYPGASVINVLASPFSAEMDSFVDEITLQSNDSVSITVDFVNTGDTAWGSGEVLLRTIDPELRSSAFYDPDTWPNPEQVGTLYEETDPGAAGTFDFVIRAPVVDETTDYVETFAIYSIDAEEWGALEDPLELHITVTPRSVDSEHDTADDAGDDGGDDGGDDDTDAPGDDLESGDRAPTSLTAEKTQEDDKGGCACSTASVGASGALALCFSGLLAVTRRRY